MTEPIRPAATVVLWREGGTGPEVLMGQRGEGAVFMPSKFVFPGGRVDPEDLPSAGQGFLSPDCVRRLSQMVPEDAPMPGAIVAAALRELTEETGLNLAAMDRPSLRFVFRAITPPGRSRRFDARFLLAHAEGLEGDGDDFSAASGELSHLRWLPLPQARALDLPFITEVVLAEVAALVAGGDQPGVPFFDNSGTTPQFRRLV
ncbi:MAG: NUDIX hydrolase [Tabrizicola flagellatus]|jgi:8-oxo-dGTP pyrophosphatase MutT (NUDIX family)|uniref:NUDIX hydrolase n=1 Tax=Tabrizicola flagellatus TaxID=2593021 RepID=UPI00391DCAEA